MYNKQRKISNMQLIVRALLNESHSPASYNSGSRGSPPQPPCIAFIART